MIENKTRRLTWCGLMTAFGLILPFALSHAFGIKGNVLLPMHIPVLLSGLLCGPLFGAITGIIVPLFSSLLTGMPAAYPMLPIMLFELLTYGSVSGLLFCKLKLYRKKFGLYFSLIAAMVCGRVTYGLVFSILLMSNPELKALSVWSAAITGLPGIIIQLILIPVIVTIIRRRESGYSDDIVKSAENIIAENTATCVVIRNNRIIKTGYGSGIGQIIDMYESFYLDGSVVVDKIVGKAAAMIMVLGGVSACKGIVMSRSARDYLEAHSVCAYYDILTDSISNRKGDGMCPMEKIVSDIDDPIIALKALKEKIIELKS